MQLSTKDLQNLDRLPQESGPSCPKSLTYGPVCLKSLLTTQNLKNHATVSKFNVFNNKIISKTMQQTANSLFLATKDLKDYATVEQFKVFDISIMKDQDL